METTDNDGGYMSPPLPPTLFTSLNGYQRDRLLHCPTPKDPNLWDRQTRELVVQGDPFFGEDPEFRFYTNVTLVRTTLPG